MVEKILSSWRVTKGDPSGFHVWFDPATEHVRLYHGPPRLRSEKIDARPVVDEGGELGYLDKVVSMSENEPEAELAPNRFEQVSILEEDSDLPF